MRLLFLSIALLLALVLKVYAQNQKTPCEEVRDGLASQIAAQATMLTEQARTIRTQEQKIVELTPKKEEPKK